MKYVAYYRVSTQGQGKSGLGLDSQKRTVKNYLSDEDSLLEEFTEVESGKKNNRPELKRAIDQAKSNDATLIFAKVDRLSRNASFILQLKESNIDIKFCDLPEANTMTLGIFALIAQQEREFISERTKKALNELKAKGVKLGSPQNLTDKARENSILARKKKAMENENNKKAKAMISALKRDNISLRKIADQLNQAGFKTSTGKEFKAMSVRRLCS